MLTILLWNNVQLLNIIAVTIRNRKIEEEEEEDAGDSRGRTTCRSQSLLSFTLALSVLFLPALLLAVGGIGELYKTKKCRDKLQCLHHRATISPVTIKIIGYLVWKTTGRGSRGLPPDRGLHSLRLSTQPAGASGGRVECTSNLQQDERTFGLRVFLVPFFFVKTLSWFKMCVSQLLTFQTKRPVAI